MKILLTLSLVFGLSCFLTGQIKTDQIPLTSISPGTNDDDLKQLDIFFSNKQIIGIGESTHGTSEFTTMRHRLFKYLVEHHQFNTFFLEADYNACKRVNRYIHGADDNVDSALCNVLLWPWITKEMTLLVDWMREYNAVNNNKLSFIGCDMQLVEDDRSELELFFDGNEEILSKIDSIFSILRNGIEKDTARVNSAFGLWNEIQTFMKGKESDDWILMENSISQWFENRFHWNFNNRDSCMAENMLFYISLYPDAKGIYFAHNWHVGKFRYDYQKYPSAKTAGYYLNEKLGDKYYTIAQLTYQGTFNVVFYKKKEIALKPIDRVFNTKNGIEKQLYQTGYPVIFTPTESFSGESYSIVSIGSIAGKPKDRPKVNEFMLLKSLNVFDSFLYIESTTPTKLIKQYSFKK